MTSTEGLNNRPFQYHLEVDLSNTNTSHYWLINLTGEHKKVLELGPSTGYISKILKGRGCQITGIEIDHEAALKAKEFCDKIIIADLDTIDFTQVLGEEKFDVILCGDVLEHLKKTKVILKELKNFLNERGYLVVSLPNIAHGDIILSLLVNKFNYTPTGLLDETHLRHFTLSSIFQIFNESGFLIKDLHRVLVEVGCTEQANNYKNLIPPSLIELIISLPESNVYQYVFRAYPTDNSRAQEIQTERVWFSSNPILKLLKLLQEQQTRLAELEDELHTLKDSLGYRLLLKFRRLKNILLPLGSYRKSIYEKYLKQIKRFI